MTKLLSQDIHLHSTFSDGSEAISVMIDAAVASGKRSIAITDHAKGWVFKGVACEFFGSANTYKNYLDQINENKKRYAKDEIKIFSGIEIEVDVDGNFQLDKGILEYSGGSYSKGKLGIDLILGSIHSESFEEDMIKRKITDIATRREDLLRNVLNLIKNKAVDVFAHPFQAIHGHFSSNYTTQERNQIIRAFKLEKDMGHKIYFEINVKKYPSYEQWDENKYLTGKLKTQDAAFIKEYLNNDLQVVIGSDSHDTKAFSTADYSVMNEIGLKPTNIYFPTNSR